MVSYRYSLMFVKCRFSLLSFLVSFSWAGLMGCGLILVQSYIGVVWLLTLLLVLSLRLE